MHQMRKKEKLEFYKSLNTLMDKQENIFLLGDFNTVLQRIDIDDSMIYRADRGEMNYII